jgi:hypothetical protein
MARVAANFIAADLSCVVGPAGPAFDLGLSDYTVCAWVRLATTAGRLTIFYTGGPSENVKGVWLYVLNGRLRAYITIQDGTLYTLTGTTSLSAGRWYHMALTIDRDGNAQLWIDAAAEGSPVDVSAKAGFDSTNEGTVTLGRSASTNFFSGELCFARVWKRLLAASELARQVNGLGGTPRARPYAMLSAAEKVGLVASWDEPPTVIDATHPWFDLHNAHSLSLAASPIIGTGTRNGDMETWTSSTDAADWSEIVNGGSTINRESTVVYAGSYSCRVAFDAAGNIAYPSQSGVCTNGKLYSCAAYARAVTAGIRLYQGDYPAAYVPAATLTTSWAQYSGTFRSTGGPFDLYLSINRENNTVYLDNVTLTAAEILTTAGPELVEEAARIPWPLLSQGEPGMASRGQPLTLQYVAWDTTANAGKTADRSNHTLRWFKDGTSAAPTNAPSESDPTNAPGVYTVALTAAECTCHLGTLTGKSSTAGVVIIPVTITFEEFRIQPLAATVSAGEVIGSDIVAYQHGRLGPYRWEITDSTGQPVNLASAALAFVACKPGRPDAPVFTLTSATGTLTVGGPDHNQVTLAADDTHTATAGTLAYVLWDKTTDAVVAVGALEIRPTPDAT